MSDRKQKNIRVTVQKSDEICNELQLQMLIHRASKKKRDQLM